MRALLDFVCRHCWSTLLSGSVLPVARRPRVVAARRPSRAAAIAKAVSPQSLHEIDAKLVGFGTRSTLSDTKSDTRGIGAARRWVKSRFEAISKDCGGCLEIVTPSQVFTGKRTPKEGVEVMDVVAIQRGTSDPDRVIVITGHLDSRRSRRDGRHRRRARRQRRCVGRLRADRGRRAC